MPHVAETLQKFCTHKESRQLICKSCHMMLKGKKELAHTCTEKTCNTLEENTHSSTEWTCTCCHTTNLYR